MEWRRWIQVLCILPALQDFLDFRVCSMQCPDTHYLTAEGGQERCCLKCSAGTRVVRDCVIAENANTTCQSCPDGSYQPTSNSERRCRRCSRQIKSNRKLLKECTRFQNQEYGACMEGFYHNRLLDACQPCSLCQRGFGVKKECTDDSNTECDDEKCGNGTYSDQASYTQKCKQCTSCRNDEKIYSECTAFTNRECRPKITALPTTVLRTTQFRSEPTTETKIDPKTDPFHPVVKGPDSERQGTRSWVMPLFIAAMSLLFILFVALIIGVTIWCHIHSKTRQRNIIVQAEDPQLVQRLTKLIDDPESLCSLPTEVSVYPYHEHANRQSRRIQENGIMLRDVSHDIIEELANFLNPTNPPSNWRKVASMLDFPWNVINNLALSPTTATQQLLERWGTKRDATVYKLYVTLKEIGRDDAAEVLERLLGSPVPSCPKSV